ncbi:MAG: S8 family serine peptidase, partial [Thermoanaerobaculia bacterium]
MRRCNRHTLRCAAVLLLLSPVAVSQAQVISPDLEDVLEDSDPGDKIAVIVTFVDKVDLTPFAASGLPKGLLRAELVSALKGQAAASQAAVEDLLDAPEVTKRRSLWATNGVALTAPPGAIEGLAHNPNIESIRLDAILAARDPNGGKASATQWNLDTIRAPELWAMGHTGAGVVVANLDTGVDSLHQDLTATWRGGSNSWLDPNGEHSTPYDADGHGTQTMGLMVGGSGDGSAIGVAPDAEWIAVKIFDDSGTATLSGIHQGFQWILDPDGDANTNDAADVVNNSWDFRELVNQCYTEFEPDIAVLRAAQIATVFSAGNQGPGKSTSVSPGNYSGAFAVGAIDSSISLGSFSSRGPSACDGSLYPEVVAPGVNVKSSDLTFGGAFPDSYAFVTGTSFSAPMVAGAMALLLSAHPDATVDDLERALAETALDLGQPGADNDYGFGFIDLVAAEAWLANPQLPLCTDLDSDTYFVEAVCGTAVDCDDMDGGINPGACDIKKDGIDQD